MAKKKDKKEKKQEQLPVPNYTLKIKYILDHFDFNKVQEAMMALDWKWQHMNDPIDQTSRIPTVKRMKDTATYLLKQVSTGKERHWATGGFHATRYKDGDIELQFVLTEYSTCDDFM